MARGVPGLCGGGAQMKGRSLAVVVREGGMKKEEEI